MNSKFVNFSPEEKNRAHDTSLPEFLSSQGETLRRSGSEYEWRDGSDKITIRGNVWFNQYERTGGDTVAFIQRYFDKDYPGAVQLLLGSGAGQIVRSDQPASAGKQLVLPPRNDNARRAAAYLINTRGIDHDVLLEFYRHGMFYESLDYHNAVFVGYDMDGVPRHAAKRGVGKNSQYKGNAEGSDPRYSFHRHGGNGVLFAFESPIDMLSLISMAAWNGFDWKRNSYCACCGVSDHAIRQMLADDPKLKTCWICFDNDQKGLERGSQIRAALTREGISCEMLTPEYKDWNEDLLHGINIAKEGKQSCQALAL